MIPPTDWGAYKLWLLAMFLWSIAWALAELPRAEPAYPAELRVVTRTYCPLPRGVLGYVAPGDSVQVKPWGWVRVNADGSVTEYRVAVPGRVTR